MSNNDEWQVVSTRRKSVSKKTPPKSSTTRKNNKSTQNLYQPPRNKDDNKGRSESRDKFDSDSSRRGGKPRSDGHDDRRSRPDKRDNGSQSRNSNKPKPNSRPPAAEDEELAIPIPKPNSKQPSEDKVWVVTKSDASQNGRPAQPKPQESSSGFHALLLDDDDDDEDSFRQPAAPEQAKIDPIEAWGNTELQHPWVFWEHRAQPRGGGQDSSYHHSMAWVGECSNVGQFWQVVNNIPRPSTFFAANKRPRASIGGRTVEGWSLFRLGVQPEWEDPKNATGAEFQMSCDSLEDCDQWWECLLLAMIGGILPCGDELMGLRVIDKSKKGMPVYRVELWFTAEAKHMPLRQGITEALGTEVKLTLKQHGKQKEVTKAAAKAARLPAGDDKGRVKQLRALLAKLTPDTFERLAPQVRGMLADTSSAEATMSAAVQCVHQCTMQTNIFHSMYADLIKALEPVPGFGERVMQSTHQTLHRRDEDARHDAKNAASFAAELCRRGIMDTEIMVSSVEGFGTGPVEVEVLCTLLKALQPQERIQPLLANAYKKLGDIAASGVLDNRLKFMVQDVLGQSAPAKKNATRRR